MPASCPPISIQDQRIWPDARHRQGSRREHCAPKQQPDFASHSSRLAESGRSIALTAPRCGGREARAGIDAIFLAGSAPQRGPDCLLAASCTSPFLAVDHTDGPGPCLSRSRRMTVPNSIIPGRDRRLLSAPAARQPVPPDGAEPLPQSTPTCLRFSEEYTQWHSVSPRWHIAVLSTFPQVITPAAPLPPHRRHAPALVCRAPRTFSCVGGFHSGSTSTDTPEPVALPVQPANSQMLDAIGVAEVRDKSKSGLAELRSR